MNYLTNLEIGTEAEKGNECPIDFNANDVDQYFGINDSTRSDQNSSENGSDDLSPINPLKNFTFNILSSDEQKFNSSLLKFNSNNDQNESNDQQSMVKTITKNDDISTTKYTAVTRKSQLNQRQKMPRKKYVQTPASIKFENDYNKLFCKDGTKVRKPLIKKYHKMAQERNQLIQIWCRKAERVRAVYFNIYAHQDQLILLTLKKLIDDGVIDYDEDEKSFASHK